MLQRPRRFLALLLLAALALCLAGCGSGGAAGGSGSGGGSGYGVSDSTTVYVSRNGKIHLCSDCSGMKYYSTMTYGQAVSRGYKKCDKCF